MIIFKKEQLLTITIYMIRCLDFNSPVNIGFDLAEIDLKLNFGIQTFQENLARRHARGVCDRPLQMHACQSGCILGALLVREVLTRLFIVLGL